jgi:hypothetical protein
MNIKKLIILFLCTYVIHTYTFEKVSYTFSKDKIDVVIPCHQKDAKNLDRLITSIKQYVDDVNRIMVISSKRFTENAEWIDEKIFPFNKASIALEIFKSPQVASYQLTRPKSRMGWIYQQFLKLFAPIYVPNISSNVLIVDADLIFLKPVRFLQENGAGLYAVDRSPIHRPYFIHAARLLTGLQRLYPDCSGITNHMLFQKPVLVDLFDLISKQHKTEAWKALARAIPVNNNTIEESALSEYEIYFNFVFARTNQVKIRHLKSTNEFNRGPVTASEIENYRARGYDCITLHIWHD